MSDILGVKKGIGFQLTVRILCLRPSDQRMEYTHGNVEKPVNYEYLL